MKAATDRKVLVVDDDDGIRQMVCKILERERFDVDRARDGAEAIEKLKQRDYNLVLLDLMMPRVDGYEVLRFLKRTRPQKLSRVVVMTALTPHEVEEPVAKVLAKPFDVGVLIEHARANSVGNENVA